MLSVILPTYNERENITPLVEAIRRSVSEPLELIIVDDHSPDQTAEVVRELEKRYQEVRLIQRVQERSLAASLSEGLACSKGEKLLWMDADFSMPPEVIPRLSEALKEYSVAIGSRYIEGGKDGRGSFLPVLLSRWFNAMARYFLGEVSDYTTGFVATRREVWERLGLSGLHGEYCIRFLYQAKRAGYPIKEIPYECRPRRGGHSKTFASLPQAIRYGKNYLWTLFSLRIKK